MAEFLRVFSIHETGMGQQLAQFHDIYMMMMRRRTGGNRRDKYYPTTLKGQTLHNEAIRVVLEQTNEGQVKFYKITSLFLNENICLSGVKIIVLCSFIVTY